MSINFEHPISKADQDFVKSFMGESAIAVDDKTILLRGGIIRQKAMKVIANKTNQIATIELNEEGDIKTMSDGTQYLATKTGWQKLPPVSEGRNGHD